MAANSHLRVTELSYDRLRDNLKTYLSSQTELQDYNFEGSVMAMLLDLLAYNTYYNAFYANMVGNEMFIDSAVLRASIVSRAKALGYTPRSAKSAKATLNLTVVPTSNVAFVTVDAKTKFRAEVSGFRYTFSTTTETTILNDNGVYTANLVIAEGTWTTERYTVADANNHYIIMNQNVDTDSIMVQVQTSASSSELTTYEKITDLAEVDSESKVYFLETNIDGRFEIFFGDGVLGHALEAGNIVIISYRVCNGAAANFITTFSKVDDIGGFSNFSFTTAANSSGGQSAETSESIRFNAPRNYAMQRRAVTVDDYKQHILNSHSDIQALAVWGGEDNDPPIYGKVYVSCKPFNGFSLSTLRKTTIVESLSKRNVLSNEVLMVDPTFIYVVPTISASFNHRVTTLGAEAIRARIISAVAAFETEHLGIFENKFRYSKFVKAIDDTHASVVSNDTTIKLQKRFTPTLNSSVTYRIPFHTELYNPHAGHLYALESSGFTLPAFAATMFLDDDGNGNVRVYRKSGTSRIYINNTLGTINYSTGIVTLNNFNPSSIIGDEIKVTVVPNGRDITPVRNQIILIADAALSIFRESDGLLLSSGKITTVGDSTSLNETPIASAITI